MTTGLDGIVVDVECQVFNSLPSIVIVGLANKAVDEAKERVRSALSAVNFQLPRKRIVINLAPADMPKESSCFDLAIATAIILVQPPFPVPDLVKATFIGELGLDGTVRPVRGIIGKLLCGKRAGIETFFVPAANIEQARQVKDITLYPVDSLKALIGHLAGATPLSPVSCYPGLAREPDARGFGADFDAVIGQERVKRAAQIAIAGGHNLFIFGSPGTGKSMVAKAMHGLLPPLNYEDILEVSHIHSLASSYGDRLITMPPFRAPHHSVSYVGFIGGGRQALPGEVSLSHRGILFLDELPEFSRAAIEALRQPLEDSLVTVVRAKQTVQYPANFILVATANPCPCGFYGDGLHQCVCSLAEIHRYQRKLSGPLLDRVDLFVQSEQVEHSQLLSQDKQDPQQSEIVRSSILKARDLQAKRFGMANRLNASLTNKELQTSCGLHNPELAFLSQAAGSLHLSARGYVRVLKVARTIADLDGCSDIEKCHISEALQYRKPSLLQ